MSDLHDKCRDKIYVRELRAAGFTVPDDVPDCAWIPRDSAVRTVGPDEFTVSIEAVCSVPFKLIEVEFTLSKE